LVGFQELRILDCSRGSFMSLLAVVGAILILVGLIAFLRARHGESENSLEFGTVKFKTKTPSLVLVVLGVFCITPRFVSEGEANESSEVAKEGASKIPEAAKKSYLAMIEAYNTRDEAGYYTAFAEPMQCFYSKANVPIRAYRKELDSRLQVDAVDLAPLDVSDERVEFCDRGSYFKGNKPVQHHKIIVMKKVGDRWLVQVETTSSQPECYRSRFASQC
jgi:hypothetical protein